MTLFIRQLNGKNSHGRIIWIIYLLLCVHVLMGCASVSKNNNIIALVDGEAITKGDIDYSLQVAHRRERLSKTNEVNIADFVEKLVDDQLIVQEARRMGMADDPQINEKTDAYILRESVLRLYREEILQNISVSESEINDYYKENYEKFSLNIIEADTEILAQEALEMLKKGSDFSEVAEEYSTNRHQKAGSQVMIERKDLNPAIASVVLHLSQGEISGITQSGNKYYIIQLLKRVEALADNLETNRNDIRKTIENNKAKQRSDKYLTSLHEKARPEVNEEILTSIPLKMTNEERKKWIQDERTLIWVYDSVLSVGNFVRMLRPRVTHSNAKDKIIKQWLDRTLIDYEALSRHYETTTDLKDMVDRYKNQLIKNAFIQQHIGSEIQITRDDLEDYYSTHKEDFRKPEQYKYQQITLKTEKDAREVINSLRAGANFSWLANTKSIDNYGANGGSVGWHLKSQLSQPIREVIEGLEPGEVSNVISEKSNYMIIKLQEKSKGGIEELHKVTPIVQKRVFKEKMDSLYNSYVERLKKEAEIEIYDDIIESIQKNIKKAQ